MTDFEAKYPKRNLEDGAFVTRLGPSPTGFIHFGNLFTANMNYHFAKQTGGIFYLRIEDTDKKREVAGASKMLIDTLSYYGITFDEGFNGETEVGNYGPYKQSERGFIYSAFAEKLLEEGNAYKCYYTEKEIEEIRSEQERLKLVPGIYGKWAKYRDENERAKAESEGLPYVIRLLSKGEPDSEKRVSIDDAIRGEISFPENFLDVVLIKEDGLPTYHFAHTIDDHFMRTTHIIRGEEWLSSVPIHIELFNTLNFEIPIYAHTTVLMKIDESGKKRKLSKRLDPELSLSYYREKGFHKDAIKEYLYTITNSNFELWRKENEDADLLNFEMTFKKMGASGILFDLNKLIDISKNVLIKISGEELSKFVDAWAEEFDNEFHKIIEGKGLAFLAKAIDIGRLSSKPRKDLYSASQIKEYIKYLFDEYFEIRDELPENISSDLSGKIIEKYLETRDFSDDKDTWFSKLKEITEGLNFAVKPKDFKKNPELYKGSITDIMGVIRLKLTGSLISPDIFEIENVLGEEKVIERLKGEL